MAAVNLRRILFLMLLLRRRQLEEEEVELILSQKSRKRRFWVRKIYMTPTKYEELLQYVAPYLIRDPFRDFYLAAFPKLIVLESWVFTVVCFIDWLSAVSFYGMACNCFCFVRFREIMFPEIYFSLFCINNTLKHCTNVGKVEKQEKQGTLRIIFSFFLSN